MISGKSAGIFLGSIGLFIIIAAFALRPDPETLNDCFGAFTKFVRIPLVQLQASGSIETKVVIPNNQRWTRIRQYWGEPRYAIAVDSGPDRTGSGWVLPVDKLGVKVEVLNEGKIVHLESTGPAPYGYSTNFPHTCLEFRADAEDKLTISLSIDQRRPPLSGEVIFTSVWPNTKDKLVSLLLQKDILALYKPALTVGFALVALAVLLLANHFRVSRR
jgi:hypothetical protein